MDQSLKIDREGSDLVVRIAGPVPNADGFHDAVRACRRTGVWACPSGECVRIERCDVRHEGDIIVLRLSPPAGQTLSVSGIDECVRYVAGRPAGTPAG
ncbi:MAG: hypothetical protein KIT28_10720 [Rubrivivax sp.]|jgi:hypothetical protein|nr:hypothetical protein [Pseudomonadota bacterium]MCW5639424.1 hypothetical protein [Rubrivivax sp.]HPP82569.1 hypothetical protein [Rubrivivax sp.]